MKVAFARNKLQPCQRMFSRCTAGHGRRELLHRSLHHIFRRRPMTSGVMILDVASEILSSSDFDRKEFRGKGSDPLDDF